MIEELIYNYCYLLPMECTQIVHVAQSTHVKIDITSK